MTSGGTVMQRHEKAVEPGREDCTLGIKGKNIAAPRISDRMDTAFPEPIDELPPPSIELTRSLSSNSSSEHAEPFGTIQLPEEGVAVLQTVMNMNKMMENQIDALRLRIDIEAKHHEKERNRIIKEKEDKLDSKEDELHELRENVNKKEEKIKTLVKEKDYQDVAIKTKIEEIEDLKKLVKQTEEYAEQLQKRFSKVKDERLHLESDTVYKHQNEQITQLKQEISYLKEKVSSMDKELARVKNIMETQNQNMRILEVDKNTVQSKFREELDKATRVMRQEVERTREVMKLHYEEMRDLRQQNQEISSDVRDIKNLLMKTQTPRQPSNHKISNKYLDVNQFQSAHALTPGPSPRRSMAVSHASSTLPRNQENVSARSSTGDMRQTNVTGQSAFPLIPNVKDRKWVQNGGKKTSMSYVSPYKSNFKK